MKYIAALDYDHLDNGLFLTTFAQALAQQKGVEAIVVHGESEYTERLIQTGIMRDEAVVRCIKDLNHRLIALFADQGVSAIGLNGYQRECITLNNGHLDINLNFFKKLHKSPVLLLSNLVLDRETQKPVPIALPRYIKFLYNQLNPDQLFLFSKFDLVSPKRPSDKTSDSAVPGDLKSLSFSSMYTDLTTVAEFKDLAGFRK